MTVCEGMPLEQRDGIPGHVLEEAATRMAAAINTNVREHYFERQLRYIKLRDNLTNKQTARERQRQINNAAMPGPTNDASLPAVISTSVPYDLEAYPERFLYPMWIMNQLFEARGEHTFRVLPLSQGFVSGASLHIDTDSLLRLVRKSNPRLAEYNRTYNGRLERENTAASATAGTPTKRKRPPPGRKSDKASLDEKDLAWRVFFNLEHVAPGRRAANQRFGHHITTDGVSVSVVILHKTSSEQEKSRKKKPKKDRQQQQQRKQQHNIASDSNNAVGVAPVDHTKVVGCDPGKHVLLHVTNEASPKHAGGDKTLRYTFKQRLHESGAGRRNKRLNERLPVAVKEAEQVLSGFNSRTVNLDKFKQYLRARFQVQPVLYAHYAKPIHRIVRWYNWRDRRSSEDKFAQRVVNEFGGDAIIAYGDSSGWHALPGLAASPTSGLRKRLRAKQHQGLQVVDVPEAFTTLTCSSCGGRTAPDLTRATRKRQDGMCMLLVLEEHAT